MPWQLKDAYNYNVFAKQIKINYLNFSYSLKDNSRQIFVDIFVKRNF